MATGSDTIRKNFSVVSLFSLSDTVRDIVNSHCHGNAKFIIDGFHCHCFK
ncbi:MAG: hypothetical protein WCG25_09165 [bacterium]